MHTQLHTPTPRPAFLSPARLGLVTTLLGATLLGACGGGGNAADPVNSGGTDVNSGTGTGTTSPGTSAATLTVSGKVMNVGYLGNTQVCADLDDDGVCGSAEPSTTTSAAGAYTLAVPTGHRGGSLLAVVRPGSTDSAATTEAPLTVQQGWTLPALLEYADGATTHTLNLSPISATYYARMRLAGRQRLNNQIAMFTRIVYETNLDRSTGNLVLPVDFDYVANPRNTLSGRLLSLHNVLNARAATAPLTMVGSAAMLASWYNTYTAPTSTAAAMPVDASKIAGFATTQPATGSTNTYTSSPEYYLAQDYRYFRPKSSAALRLREGLTETAGWLRLAGHGQLDTFDSRANTLSNGAVLYKLSRLTGSTWADLTVDEGAFLTLDSAGAAVVNSGTDYLQPRTITHADGNRVSFRNLYNNGVWGFDVADSPGTDFYIEEWVGEQRSYASYYNGTAPTTDPLTAAPTACNRHYPGSVQRGSNTSATTDLGTGTTASAWFATCFDYYTAEYYDQVMGDLALRSVVPTLPGANFYDATLRGSLLVAPARSTCRNPSPHASDVLVAPLATVTTKGLQHCNWAVNAQAGHVLGDLFAADGVAINSWSKYYGTTAFTTGGVTTLRTAGTADQTGLPQQLTLRLVRVGDATSGTGTLTSPYGAWTATSYTSTVETIQWRMSAENPHMVLIAWPFRDINDPRVKTNTASDGTAAASAPVLPAGQFSATWNGNTFSAAPSTHTAPNYRQIAVLLQDGVFVTGQYYGNGYTYNERYFTRPAMAEGIKAMNHIFGKLYSAGFVDR